VANYFRTVKRLFNMTTFLLLLCIYSCDSGKNGLEIFLVNGESHLTSSTPDCGFCFEPTTITLSDKPLLLASDIEYFDWTNQQIKLKESGLEKIKKLEIPLGGLRAAMVVDSKPIYGFWFWNEFSSLGCDYVFTYPTMDFKIGFGLPTGHAKGNDPRFDTRLKESLTKSGLLK
jgi:hypothetical protein